MSEVTAAAVPSSFVTGMRELITYMVKSVVDVPDEVRVELWNDALVDKEQKPTYIVHVDPSDVGKVLGKHGRIANAIRVLAKCVAMKYKERVYVQIEAPRSE